MKLVVASNNLGKIREIKDILKDLQIEVVSQSEAGFDDIEVIEDGQTLEANAKKKAQAICTNEMVIADDTGLFVRALDGPGVYTARYAGEHASDEDNRLKMLKNLEGIEDRYAEFITCMIVKYKDNYYMANGVCKGSIACEEKGENGFGYDSIFIPEGYNKTFAQLEDEVKNKISHRSKALEAVKILIGELINE